MNIIDQLIPIIRHAGDILLEYRLTGFETHTKSDAHDFVTTADTASDAYLREEIIKLFPEDKILSEESGILPNDYTGRVWMIDPLDGTRAYVEGSESFSVMIGLAIEGVAMLGITYAPMSNVLYYAEKGFGAFVVREGKSEQIHVSAINSVRDARIVDYRRTAGFRILDKYVDALGFKVAGIEGTNTLKVGRIAEGNAEVVINTNTNVCKWDFCAPQVILEEAGGKVTDTEGNPIDYLSSKTSLDKSFVATNGILHQVILEALKKQMDII